MSDRPLPLLTVKDLARQTGMSVSTIYRKRSNGESLPRALVLGKSALRWRQSEVDLWLDAQLEPNAA
ncbi:helix-turn-helix transcriptional regulator [Microbacterium foliorum]|uniref:helix-turn-helix transcriptional regulator n=1 Tax=Microbacterium foliorum TaxID=104336 RepID=UPI0037C590C0